MKRLLLTFALLTFATAAYAQQSVRPAADRPSQAAVEAPDDGTRGEEAAAREGSGDDFDWEEAETGYSAEERSRLEQLY